MRWCVFDLCDVGLSVGCVGCVTVEGQMHGMRVYLDCRYFLPMGSLAREGAVCGECRPLPGSVRMNM